MKLPAKPIRKRDLEPIIESISIQRELEWLDDIFEDVIGPAYDLSLRARRKRKRR